MFHNILIVKKYKGMKARQTKNHSGFTLIELLIVIAIIGLLATLAIISLTTAQRKARDTKRVADIKQLQNAVELYYSENAAYPVSSAYDVWADDGDEATNDDFGEVIAPFITNIPIDPQNTSTNVYTYGSTTDEYFIGALLEDTDHSALDGDDDTAYTTSELAGLNVVDSDDAGAVSEVAAFSCVDDVYCVSE